MSYQAGLWVGALVITFLMIRFANWCLRKVGVDRLGVAHVLAAVVSTILGAYGFADGGEPKFLFSASRYVPCAIVWLLVDYFRPYGKKDSDTPAG